MYDAGPYTFIAWVTQFISILCGYMGVGIFLTGQKIRPLTLRERQPSIA